MSSRGTSTAVNYLTRGYVVSQNPDNRSIAVMLRDGQILPFVYVLHYGQYDAVRISQRPLPGRGQQVALAMLDCDINSYICLGTIQATLADAVGSSGDAFLDYESHFSGWWSALASGGTQTISWPDGSTLVVGASAFAPTRHVVNANGQRTSVAFTQAERVPNPPAAFPMQLTHASGTEVSIASGGAVVVSGVGAVSIYSPGTITLQAASIILSDGGSAIALLNSGAYTIYNEHTHSSNGAPPSQQMTSADLTSVVTAQ